MTFIGSKISLISNLLVRYEGTLYTIDPQESTIALQNVRMMGTEDRSAEKVIKPSSTIYEYMIFNGENIKKLEMVKEENEFEDPAIVEARELPSAELQSQEYYNNQQRKWGGQNNQGIFYSRGGRTTNYGRGRRVRRGGYNRRYSRGGYRNRGGNRSNSARTEATAISRGSDRPNRGRGRRNSNRNTTSKNDKKVCPGTGKFLERQSKENDDGDLEIQDKEFDFQGNLARFDMSSMKEALVEKEALSEEVKVEGDDIKPLDEEEENPADDETTKNNEKEDTENEKKPAYEKESFFDTLSTDRDMSKRPTGSEMRELDAETFGKIGSTYRCRTRWFRRWRGNFRGRGARGGSGQRNAN